MLMVVGLLGDRIHKLATVGYLAAVIGETVLARVVGPGEALGGGILGPDHGHQHEQHEGRHDNGDRLAGG